MKTRNLQNLALTLTAVAAVTFLAAKAAAQDSTTSTTTANTTPAAQPAAASPVAPQLSYGVSQVMQLAHANVGEDVIVNYIQNSGNGYGLDADQILYLKQQGISDRIINAMLNQRSRLTAAQTAPPPNYSDANNSQIPTPTPAPAVSYAQTAPPQTVYVIPDTQTYDYYAYSDPYYYPYYYPYYGYYGWPGVSLSFGWGGYYGGYR
ncbi:MAG: hypothetical protein WBW41_14350, partial [Verrucomicrobiia bacterium]